MNALRAFEAAGRCGSFTAAARELNVSVAAVSRHVALLEAHFGISLLVRHRAGVDPTSDGAAYLTAVAAAFDGIDAASAALSRHKSQSVLRLLVYTSFTTEWLAPRLPAFRALHPDIEINLVLSVREPDAHETDFDFLLTALPRFADGLHHDRLFEMYVALVCSQQLLSSPPGMTSPAELHRQTLLFAPRERQLWEGLLTLLGRPGLEDHARVEFDTLSLTLQAARGSAGVALGNLFFVADDLATGRLVAPFEQVARFDVPHYLCWPSNRRRKPAAIVFEQWLKAEVARTNALLQGLLAAQTVTDVVLPRRT